VNSLMHDLRYAVRGLKRSPGFASVAVVTLALGIGATTAIFSLLDALIFKSLPVKNPEELVLVRGGGQYPAFQAFRRHTDIFTDLFASGGVTRLDVELQGGAAEVTDVSLVSGSYFSALGIQAAIGRTFTALDDQTPGQHPVAVASHQYWQRRFGGDAGISDRVVRISGMPFTIIGVAPRGFFGEQVGASPDLWVPLSMWGQIVPGRNVLESPGTSWLRILGRVRPGIHTSGTQAALRQTFQQVLMEIFGPNVDDDLRSDIARATVTFEPTATGVSQLRGELLRPLQLLMGAVLLVLLIACANIANLLLARAAARRREIDVRLALGMSRGRLIRQLLTETFLLASLGGSLGVAFAWLGREALLRLISADGSRLPVTVTTDARLLAFVVVISFATAVLFGLAPAWQSVRARIVTSLMARREGGGPPQQRLSSVLVIVQVAVSLVLLMGAGLFLRTIANLQSVDLGFAPDRLIIFDVTATGYRGDQATALTRRILNAIKTTRGVSSVSFSEHGVLMGRDSTTDLMRPLGFVAGREGFPRTHWDVVGAHYFSTIGTPIIAGRDFTERDDVRSPFVVAINEEMAGRFFNGSSAIGRRLVWDVGGRLTEFEIVAVTRDVKHTGARDEPEMRFYVPYLQLPAVRPTWILSSTRFLVRAEADAAALTPVLRQAIRSEDARVSVTSVDVVPLLVSRTILRERMVAILLVVFGVFAIGLACLGLYGLIAYYVVQRTSEIGIRVALGAQYTDVVWMMLRRSLRWIAAGIALGVPLAVMASRLIQSQLFGLRATDSVTLLAATVIVASMGLLAGYLPARRAARVDPLTALRYE
jgi:predicted permease